MVYISSNDRGKYSELFADGEEEQSAEPGGVEEYRASGTLEIPDGEIMTIGATLVSQNVEPQFVHAALYEAGSKGNVANTFLQYATLPTDSSFLPPEENILDGFSETVAVDPDGILKSIEKQFPPEGDYVLFIQLENSSGAAQVLHGSATVKLKGNKAGETSASASGGELS